MDRVETIIINGTPYQKLLYGYHGDIHMASSRRKDQRNRDSYTLDASPEYICESELEDCEIVIGTEGLASQFSPEHFLVISMHPDIEHIAHALDYYVLDHPEKRFLLTKVFCGMIGMTPEYVAPAFAGLLWYDNVKMPAEFIDILEKETYYFARKNIKLGQAHIDALYNWRNSRKQQRVQSQYGDIFKVLPKDRVGEIARMICAADDGEYMNVEFINSIRNALQDFFAALHTCGYILTSSEEISGCGGELKNMHMIPGHIRTFTFSLIGIVNSGSHPSYYRRVIGQGHYHNLLRSMTYMLISIIEWWAAGFPMLEEEGIKRSKEY